MCVVSEIQEVEEQTTGGESSLLTSNASKRFEGNTVHGRTVVSDVSFLAVAQARLCLLTT